MLFKYYKNTPYSFDFYFDNSTPYFIGLKVEYVTKDICLIQFNLLYIWINKKIGIKVLPI